LVPGVLLRLEAVSRWAFYSMRSGFDLMRSGFDLMRSGFDLTRSSFDLMRSGFDLMRSSFDLMRSGLAGVKRQASSNHVAWSFGIRKHPTAKRLLS
jgi:hypothetical protein